ncbi:MAG: hypothetical protein HDR80_08575 [Bacteroides sp.]|nr:hypothetical protein [Bacteroides sp.]
MREITITIDKEEVYEEVGQTTSYTGAKMEGGDDKTYDRIFTTEGDRSQLERFWNESCVDVCEALKEFIKEERNEKDSFSIFLGLSSSFDPALEPAMKKELFSFFVTNIVSKWYVFTNKKEAADFSASAAGMLDGVKRKAYYRRRPKRPTRGAMPPS